MFSFVFFLNLFLTSLSFSVVETWVVVRRGDKEERRGEGLGELSTWDSVGIRANDGTAVTTAVLPVHVDHKADLVDRAV